MSSADLGSPRSIAPHSPSRPHNHVHVKTSTRRGTSIARKSAGSQQLAHCAFLGATCKPVFSMMRLTATCAKPEGRWLQADGRATTGTAGRRRSHALSQEPVVSETARDEGERATKAIKGKGEIRALPGTPVHWTERPKPRGQGASVLYTCLQTRSEQNWAR